MATEIVGRATQARTIAWLTCGTCTALALALRMFDLSNYGLDPDEVFSVLAARSAWDEMFSIVVNDKSHPPLHYVVLKLSIGLGAISETWARLPSVLFGVGLVPVAYAICRELRLKLLDELLVLVLVATNSALIYFAQYARMFAALEFFAALSLLLFIRLWKGFSWRTWTMLTVVNTLMVYSHYWGMLVIATQCLLMFRADRKKVATMVLSGAITAILFLPWAVLVGVSALRQEDLAGQISWMGSEVPDLIDHLWLIAVFNGLITIDNTTAATRFGLILFSLPVAALCLRLILDRGHRDFFDLNSPGFWIVIIATPLVLTTLGSYISEQNLWGERHLTIVALPYYILIGLSLTRLKPELLANILRCSILVWAIVSTATYLARDDKKFHFEVLAGAITSRNAAPVYVSERYFIGQPLSYHLESATEIPVTEERDLHAITDARFWYVYRDTTWSDTAPETQFSNLGYTITASAGTRWWNQKINALLIEKSPRPGNLDKVD